ncbi:Cell morphogenesis protein PAG1 [Zalaria obscura]|uniref:Cell morphogenesis protein PAG1 n=1 Tax=Zalaria obscura TaxID=2024903 RepID=A0ACC3SDJ2_9PEZI
MSDYTDYLAANVLNEGQIRESSSIFKSFAKAKPKVAKQETESSKEPSPAPEDNPMAGVSDDDNEEDSMMLDDQPAKEPTGKSKKEREEELRKMMEAEDEPMEDAPSNPIDAPNEIVPEEKQESQNKEEPIETVTVTNGRRRGRRRVMKKKTVRDEEGYLVTKEEAAWESFSEDEPAPKKAKTSVAPPAAKAKKGGKPGQGNIMSFFSKNSQEASGPLLTTVTRLDIHAPAGDRTAPTSPDSSIATSPPPEPLLVAPPLPPGVSRDPSLNRRRTHSAASRTIPPRGQTPATQLQTSPSFDNVCGPSADAGFDQLISALGHIVRHKPKSLIDSLMLWRKGKSDATTQLYSELQAARSTGGQQYGTMRRLDSAHSVVNGTTNQYPTAASAATISDIEYSIRQAERRSAISVYILCRVLIEVIKQCDLAALTNDTAERLEDTIWIQLCKTEPEAVYHHAIKRAQWDIFGRLLGEMSRVRFDRVVDKYITDLETAHKKLGVKGHAEKELETKTALLVHQMRFLQVKSYPEEAWDSACDLFQLLASLSASADRWHRNLRVQLAEVEAGSGNDSAKTFATTHETQALDACLSVDDCRGLRFTHRRILSTMVGYGATDSAKTQGKSHEAHSVESTLPSSVALRVPDF